MSVDLVLTVTRANAYDTSYEVWAKAGSGPLEYGDGIYVGNVPIAPSATSAIIGWTAPAAGVWYFTATQVQNGMLGATGKPQVAT